jgi:prepilin-type N-terminal cleavage/methylation domain-containing protein
MKRAAIYNSQGFSLVELIVVMAMFLIIIAVTGDTFSRIMTRSSVQSKGAASNIEGIVGLEMMRKDLASVGFGLPWSFDSSISYKEVKPGATDSREAIAAAYNVTPNVEDQTEVPMAVSGGNNVELTPENSSKLIQGSDYLVIRATSIGSSQTSQRWSFMNYTGTTKPVPLEPESWSRENLAEDDWVVVLRVGLSAAFTKELVSDAGSFTTQYNNLANFEPDEKRVAHYIYGVSTSANKPRMPFNRADYYVRIPLSTEENRLPQRCAPNTGILYKALVDHANGSVSSPGSELPLLDCVADLQVVYILDSSSNGQITETESLAGLTMSDIRDQLKSIQVYVLSHEGGKDSLYTYPNETIAVGPTVDGITAGSNGRTFNLKETIKTGWERYRWKIYRFTVNPLNLGAAL